MEKEKMIMTKKLADQIMETLACIAISATGGATVTTTGEINIEQLNYAETYAKEAFIELLSYWEEVMGKEWDIQ